MDVGNTRINRRNSGSIIIPLQKKGKYKPSKIEHLFLSLKYGKTWFLNENIIEKRLKEAKKHEITLKKKGITETECIELLILSLFNPSMNYNNYKKK